MKNIIFISDYFIEQITGGAELCNDALITEHLKKNYFVIKIKSENIDEQFLINNKNNFFVIANFFLLSEKNKNFIIKNINYCILEHDHKYLKNNNPAVFKNYLSNENNLQNIDFYKNAKYVLCQSNLHSEIVFKNTMLKNIINLKGNIWREEHFCILESFCDSDKNIKHGIIHTENKNKGMLKSIEYCYQKNIKFDFIHFAHFSEFIKKLSEVQTLIFMPTWIETFSRLSIEAKILGCNIISNSFIGAASDGYLKYSGKKLLNIIKEQQQKIFKIFDDIIFDNKVETFKCNLPKIDIIATFIDGEKYIEDYLNFVSQQTIFQDIELYLLDAGSRGKEKEIILKFAEKYDNIHYIRKEEKINISESFNYIIKNSKNDLISFICIDDCPLPSYAETLRKHLYYSDNIDLVYGDCLESSEQIKKNNIENLNIFYNHSLNEFSRENMIKCLPGPMSMFKRSMIEKNGYFNETMNFANDWELWLRCVRNGSSFKKVDKVVGIYFKNPDGNSTTQDTKKAKDRHIEEKQVFCEYKDVFGLVNYNLYKAYFDSL